MNSSLYARLTSLVNDKATGVLLVKHKYGEQGKLFLIDGQIIDCNIGELNGVEAARKISKWLSFNAQFTEDMIVRDRNKARFNTKDFLTFLGKIDIRSDKIKKYIPSNSARFKMHLNGSKKEINLKPTHLKIALALDGKKTITQLVSELNISEFEVLNTIMNFREQGIAVMVGAHRPMEDTQKASFLNSLKDILSDLVGPAAEAIIDDAFESINLEGEFLARREIPEIINAIATYLDIDEKSVFLEWWRNQSEWK